MKQADLYRIFPCALLMTLQLSCGTSVSPFTGDVGKDLKQVDAVIAAGPHTADWSSLRHEVPQWYQDAKFGIFIHWGVYAVPAFGNEWYPRRMYIDEATGRGNYFQHHLQTWGPQKTFGYKDFIPMFTAKQFDASAWAKLFREAGARYVVPVAEHHDGFPMYNCSYTPWNAARMGPKRDIVGELARAVRSEDMYFGVSTHRAFDWAYYQRDDSFDTVDPANFGLYGRPQPFLYGGPWKNPWPAQDKEFKNNWLARTCELAERYQPDLLWFDFGIGPGWVQSPETNPYAAHLKRFTAYYYNRAAAWGRDVAINYKHHAFPEDVAVLDIERGKLNDLRPLYWQTDTSVMYNSWGYVSDPEYRTVDSIVDDLADIVSKNGCLLLNIGPKADGTIPAEQQDLLRGVGRWLQINGEAIYDTRPWTRYGEGPTEAGGGSFGERDRKYYTAADIRFTTRGTTLYAIALAWPDNGALTLQSLGENGGPADIASVSLLGYGGTLEWKRTDAALTVQLPDTPPCDHAYVLKIGTTR